MKCKAAIVLLICFSALTACDKPKDTKLYETERNALEKAKQVEGQVQQQTQQLQKNLEEQTK